MLYATNLLQDATEARSLGKVALLRQSRDMRPPGMRVRKAIKAGGADDWSELMKSYYQAKQEDDHRAATTTGKILAESWLYRTVRTSARRRCFLPTLHRRRRANISCVLS